MKTRVVISVALVNYGDRYEAFQYICSRVLKERLIKVFL